MAEFTPINSQEEFDSAISARLERERAKYSDYDALRNTNAELQRQLADANAQATTAQQTIADLTAKVSAYEADSVKTRIALETGLPVEFRDRLRGDTEDALRTDAENLMKFLGKKATPQPLAGNEPKVAADPKQAALQKMLSELKR